MQENTEDRTFYYRACRRLGRRQARVFLLLEEMLDRDMISLRRLPALAKAIALAVGDSILFSWNPINLVRVTLQVLETGIPATYREGIVGTIDGLDDGSTDAGSWTSTSPGWEEIVSRWLASVERRRGGANHDRVS